LVTHKKIGKIIGLYILIFVFFDSVEEDKDSVRINSKNSLTSVAADLLKNGILICGQNGVTYSMVQSPS